MPAEWEPHEATWLAWPVNVETWPGKRLERVRGAYEIILEALLQQEKVKLLARKRQDVNDVCGKLRAKGVPLENLVVYETETVDSWIRDYGPTFVKSRTGGKAWCKWRFNAWGGKYDSLAADNGVFLDLSLVDAPCFQADLVLEGGSIEVNGSGTCLTTEQCLLNANRNPHLSRRDIETLLSDYLGVHQILWLHEGIVGDDTDGHIDDIARFVSADTIVAAHEENQKNPNYAILQNNWERLESFRRPDGSRWRLVKLPMPSPVLAGGVPLPASYANFYVANKCVLLPVFDDPRDTEAAGILKSLFLDREIVPVPARDMVYGLGTLHCLSQQEPA